jgi:hypothetical protein
MATPLSAFFYCLETDKICRNKNIYVDIKSSAHDSFLEEPSSGKFKVERLESQIISKVLGISKPKPAKNV